MRACARTRIGAEIRSPRPNGEEVSMTTIVLADDHNLVREGLKHLLAEEARLKLVGEARDGIEAVELVEKLRPEILLLDLMLPRLHGLEVIRQVRKNTRFS